MLGNDIRHYRQRLGLSSKTLARLVGVAPDTVDSWESGELQVPRSVRLRVVLERLEIRHREMLSSPGGLCEWALWLEQLLLEGRSDITDALRDSALSHN
jgi:DNA-binding XRE family transcriptional regulator